MVKKIAYEDMDFVDKGKISKRKMRLDKIMDKFGLHRCMGELYLSEMKANKSKEKPEQIELLKVMGLM